MAEEKILDRVRKLLDLANGAGATDSERQAALDMADKLMLKHAIDEAMLEASMSKEERRKPISSHFQASDPHAPHWQKFKTVMSYLAKLQRVRVAFHYNGDVTLVGYFEDVEYVKMKFLNVYLHFSKTIDPRWDNALTPEHNVYNFKVAGRQWQDIQEAAAYNGVDKPFHWFKPAYRRHCKLIGEEPTRHTQRNFAYRESFAEAFRTRICERVDQLIKERENMTAEAGALVLMRDLGIEIDEMFYTLFPSFRPATAEEIAAMEARIKERERLEQEELERKLEAMSPKERAEYDRQQEEERRRQARADKDYWKRLSASYDSAGHAGGRASADKVDLSRNEGVSSSSTRKEL